jgi:hypothetical protein
MKPNPAPRNEPHEFHLLTGIPFVRNSGKVKIAKLKEGEKSMQLQIRQSILAALALAAALITQPFSVLAQGTAFTYQGRLNNNGAPANGSYDFRFRAASDSLGNNFVGNPSLINGVTVTNGLFTAPVDFGAGIFNGSNFWLQVEVRTNGAGGYSALFPPQPLTPTPYAIMAGTVVSGGIPAIYTNSVNFNNPANNFSGNGTGLTGLWQLTGNAGTAPGANFLGTIDNQPLEFRVNGARGFRIEPTLTNGAVNVIGGGISNSVNPGIVGATIGGGGAVGYLGLTFSNRVTGDFGVVGGGAGNVTTEFGFVGGGLWNHTVGQAASVIGGIQNTASGGNSIVGGGAGNVASGGDAVVAGGGANTSSGGSSVVGGGDSNTSSADNATVAGGSTNRATDTFATVGGGHNNWVDGQYSTIGGGSDNTITAANCVISGGHTNLASLAFSTVGGGFGNTSSGTFSTVPGGSANVAAGSLSFAAGNRAKAMNPGTFVWSDSQNADFASTANNQFLVRALGGVGIGTSNPAAQLHVASSNAVLFWITQNNPNDFTRLRMKVATNQSWEMDVSTGVTPSLQFWNATLRMTIDYNGNVSATSFNPTSDRNAKENFQSVNPLDVLDKVSALPISRWNFKNDAATTHLGPMAQDFHAAFDVGVDDKHIATVDADGVALAAIQGLNRKLTEELKRRDTENAEMKQELGELKQLVSRLSQRFTDDAD